MTNPVYPPDWNTIRTVLYARAGWRCEHCGMEFEKGSTKAITARNADGKPAILTIHHLDGNTTHNHWSNLVALCQACHLHIQAIWKPGGVIPAQWGRVPRWILERGLPYQVSAFQMRLF
jgi:5-methylcytosine-specific restriction endonuclease McrA